MRNLKLLLKQPAIEYSRRWLAGFTYLELIIYMSIVTIMMTALIPFAWNAIEGGVKSATEREVFSQAQYASERIKYEIRNAIGINSVTATQVSLATANPATNPTIIASTSGNITIQQGAGSPVILNSHNTSISSLNFTNYSSADNMTENIQYVFTIAANYQGAGSRQEYKASTTIEGSAEVRSNTTTPLPTSTPTPTPSPTPSQTWFNTAYLFKKKITINHTQVSGGSDLSNFSVLISFIDPDLKQAPTGKVQNASGYDIIYTDSTETTKLDHEIENYVPSTGEVEMWVRIPTLSASADTVIYMYFGNGSITTSQENKTGVWTNGFTGVWHLQQSGNGTSGEFKDSTSNGNNATGGNGSSSQTPTRTTGKIGYGQNFNASNNQWIIDNATSGLGNINGIQTVSLWYDVTTNPNSDSVMFGEEDSPTNNGNRVEFNGETNLEVTNDYGGDETGVLVSMLNPSAGVWHYFTWTWDGTTSREYVDCSQNPQATSSISPENAPVSIVEFGGIDHSGTPGDVYNGLLDEVEMSNTLRSGGWIATECVNQNTPSTFYAVSPLIGQ